MVDFVKISTRPGKRGTTEVYPRLRIMNSKDLMIRGGDFYAIWLEDRGLWSTNEMDVVDLIDDAIEEFYNNHHEEIPSMHMLKMGDAETGMIDAWHRYCQRQMRDNYVPLDEHLVFANSPVRKEDYASKRLPYPLEAGDFSSWDRLIGTLYSEEERHKLEWAIGSIVSGDSKKLQKFLVLYGAQGTGKSTILNVIEKLFAGYCSIFDAHALGSASNQFALEAFRSNPLVAIQHDGDLSRIEDNTRLNSLVSHEKMTVNEKFKSTYEQDFKAMLFMGTNKPVRITDAKSGLLRRLIDVSPSGNTLNRRDYEKAVGMIPFELGAIAYHCLDVYTQDPHYYDDYTPLGMVEASNDFYNFMADHYMEFKKENSITLRDAWELYKIYVEDAKVPYPMSQRVFREELKNYFYEYYDRYTKDDGSRVRSYYKDLILSKFDLEPVTQKEKPTDQNNVPEWLQMNSSTSAFDNLCADYFAQYANPDGYPKCKWEQVQSHLRELDTSKLHYVAMPINHIVIDFDLTENGEKSLEANLREAAKFPPTYAELSKSGKGVHLHYFYTGDAEKLSRVYSDKIEIKVFTGKSALRRLRSKCNSLEIATISSGLPLKEEVKKVVNEEIVKNEKAIRTIILRNLNKEYHSATKPSIDYIYKILEDAQNAGTVYDVEDLKGAVIAFAAGSTHNSDYCLKLVNKMKFKSAEIGWEAEEDKNTDSDGELLFFDMEVYPNHTLLCYMDDKSDDVVVLTDPDSRTIAKFCNNKIVGFNNKRYDNHILYAIMRNYDQDQIFKLSQSIIEQGVLKCGFMEAYNLSYTDIYDFASAGNKMSLKKLEIKMGIHHQEMGLPWDQPVSDEDWDKVIDYCKNDVRATRAAFHFLEGDWTARCILAELAGMSRNTSTNKLTETIIFGKNKHPQNEFCWRDMSQPVTELDPEVEVFLKEACPEMMSTLHYGYEGAECTQPSLLPYFPGYKYDPMAPNDEKSSYRGVTVGEGGYVFANPEVYGNVALLDISSMHPHSAIAECIFGPRFTRAFRDIVEGRVSIKHQAWDEVNSMLDGKLTPFIQKIIDGEMKAKDLANGLKTAINSVYGLTCAKHENPFRDPRNIDNIVAKRGALFMVNLKHEVMKRGFQVVHIKTDSIKIADATPDIIKFVMDYGRLYGYTFEHEATYDRICLVNNAVYIAKFATVEKCMALYGYAPGENIEDGGKWTATGTQFQVPYVFKTLFSKEEITFDDMCETKTVTKGDICLDCNEGLGDNHNYVFVGRVGQFCPVIPGNGSGELICHNGDKYSAVTGTKGYRWMESEVVRQLHLEDTIDKSYYNKLVDDALAAINEYCDTEWFCSDAEYDCEIGIPGQVPF